MCRKRNHPTERRWQGAGAHLPLKRTRHDEKAKDESNHEGNSRSLITTKFHPQANPLLKSLSQKLISSRLQIHDLMSVRQNVISDPPMINFCQYIKDTNGTPSVVWQQQIEKAYIKTHKVVHNDRPV